MDEQREVGDLFKQALMHVNWAAETEGYADSAVLVPALVMKPPTQVVARITLPCEACNGLQISTIYTMAPAGGPPSRRWVWVTLINGDPAITYLRRAAAEIGHAAIRLAAEAHPHSGWQALIDLLLITS